MACVPIRACVPAVYNTHGSLNECTFSHAVVCTSTDTVHRVVVKPAQKHKRFASDRAHFGDATKSSDFETPFSAQGKVQRQRGIETPDIPSPKKRAPPTPAYSSPLPGTRLVKKPLLRLDSPLPPRAQRERRGNVMKAGVTRGDRDQYSTEPGFARRGLTCFINATLAVLLRVPQFLQVLDCVQDAICTQHGDASCATLTAALQQVQASMRHVRNGGGTEYHEAIDMTAVVRVSFMTLSACSFASQFARQFIAAVIWSLFAGGTVVVIWGRKATVPARSRA